MSRISSTGAVATTWFNPSAWTCTLSAPFFTTTSRTPSETSRLIVSDGAASGQLAASSSKLGSAMSVMTACVRLSPGPCRATTRDGAGCSDRRRRWYPRSRLREHPEQVLSRIGRENGEGDPREVDQAGPAQGLGQGGRIVGQPPRRRGVAPVVEAALHAVELDQVEPHAALGIADHSGHVQPVGRHLGDEGVRQPVAADARDEARRAPRRPAAAPCARRC